MVQTMSRSSIIHRPTVIIIIVVVVVNSLIDVAVLIIVIARIKTVAVNLILGRTLSNGNVKDTVFFQ